MPESQKRHEKKWAKELTKARENVQAWKDAVQKSESIKKSAVELLEICSKRMYLMQEKGELGVRKNSDGDVYPQLRIVYWGEIESGTMNLVCIEVDYGYGDKARVGLWSLFRSIWDSQGLSGIMERSVAWWGGRSLGKAIYTEEIWKKVKACLKVLSSDLELDLNFDDSTVPLSPDDNAWNEWLEKEGQAVQPLMILGLPSPEAVANKTQWDKLELQAQWLLRSAKNQASLSEINPIPPNKPDNDIE